MLLLPLAVPLALSGPALGSRTSTTSVLTFVRQGVICQESGATAVRAVVPKGAYDDLAWSPDGARVAVVSNRGRHSFLDVMRADGTRRHRIARTALKEGFGGDMNPTWSPDGTRVAFVGPRSLFVARADGRSVTKIYTFRAIGTVGYPQWSTRSGRIFFTLIDIGPVFFNPVSIHPDGTGLRAESPTKQNFATDGFSWWSSDGTHRAGFSRDGIEIVLADGSNRRLVVPDTNWATVEPPLRWSPDDELLAFLRRAPATPSNQAPGDVWVVDLRTGEQRRVTNTPQDESAPAWRAGADRTYGSCP